MKTKNLYATIAKSEEQDDGTIKVWGYASSGEVDVDGETITADCMKAAIPAYMEFGAVREMHDGSKAAGTAIEASVGDDGKTWFGAHVVDPVAVLKVKNKVYKGFSVGGRVTERDTSDKKIIKGLNLIEVSLVDRPANPEAKIELYKRDEQVDPVEELANLLDDGAVTPLELVRLAKAAKAATDVKGAATTIKDVRKGIYEVSRFAECLQSLAYMAQGATYEAEYEGDASPVPAALSAWVAQGAEIFGSMAKEEVDELVTCLNAMVATTETADKVAKRGARFSKTTKGALAAIHKAAKEADEHLSKLGYADADEPEEDGGDEGDEEAPAADEKKDPPKDEAGDKEAPKEDAADKVAKAATTTTEDLIAKALAPFKTQLDEALAKVASQAETIDTLKKSAAPGRSFLKVYRGDTTKAADSVPATDTPAEAVVPPPEGTHERAMFEMKKSLTQPGRLVG